MITYFATCHGCVHAHRTAHVRGMTKPSLQVEDKANAQKDKPAAAAGDAAPQPNSAAAAAAVAAAAAATPGPSTTGAATPRPASTLSRQGSGRAGGTPKGKDTPRTSGKTAAKGSKKVVPASFVEVIDCLVDVCLQYKGVQPGEEADLADPETSKDSAPFFEVGQGSSTSYTTVDTSFIMLCTKSHIHTIFAFYTFLLAW